MKSAVEQFWQDVQDILPSSVDTETGIKLVRAFEQAKEMEEEQMIEFASNCIHRNSCFFNIEEYYETFKQKEQ
jgi:hypothetical protein